MPSRTRHDTNAIQQSNQRRLHNHSAQGKCHILQVIVLELRVRLCQRHTLLVAGKSVRKSLRGHWRTRSGVATENHFARGRDTSEPFLRSDSAAVVEAREGKGLGCRAIVHDGDGGAGSEIDDLSLEIEEGCFVATLWHDTNGTGA